jgi:dipeptidyl aminopeptidase/acylaminoacyl peptidase
MTAPLLSFLLFASNAAWTTDALMSIKTVGDPQISADGARIAYVVRQVDTPRNRYDSAIWVRESDTAQARSLAQGHRTDSSPRWSPEGLRLAFLSRRDGPTQIYIANASGSSAQPLASSTGVEFFRWSPDGKYIGIVKQVPVAAERAAQIAAGFDARVAGQDIRNSGILLLDASSGSTRWLKTPRHVLTFDWSPDGTKVVYSAQKSGRARERFATDIYELQVNTGADSALVEQPGQDLFPCYSPDGNSVAFHSQVGSAAYFGPRQVGVVPSGGGTIRYVTESLDGDVFGGGSKIWWSPDSSRIVFGAGKSTKDYLYSLNVRTGQSTKLLEQLSGTGSFSLTAKGDKLAWVKASNSAPPEVVLRDLQTNNDLALTNLNPQVKSMPEVRAETVRWTSKDGLAVEGVLRLPFNYQKGKPVPLLTIIHGGPTGASLENFPVPRLHPVQLFLQNGYGVFEPNFRGSINYGAKFRTPTIQQQGFGDMSDIMTGIDSLIEKGIADRDRLGVLGWSYGGYLSSWMIAHTDRFKAAAVGACAMDWTTYYGMAVGADDGPREVLLEYFGGTPWKRFEAYDRHSQRAFLKNVKTPSLLLRGERDTDTMGEMYVALEDLNVPVEFVTYPREPHGIGEPSHQRDLLERHLAWFQKWMPKAAR